MKIRLLQMLKELPQPQKQGGCFRAAARIFLRALPLLLVYRKCCDLMGLPVTFSGKPILHKHVSSGENSRLCTVVGSTGHHVSQFKFLFRLV